MEMKKKKLFVVEVIQQGKWKPLSLYPARSFREVLDNANELSCEKRIKRVKTAKEAAKLLQQPLTTTVKFVSEEIEWV